jgi:hypothetical protein
LRKHQADCRSPRSWARSSRTAWRSR